MSFAWVVISTALLYLLLLFVVASIADRRAERSPPRARPVVYALALGVYCTSWTFYGVVGFASRSGFDFLTIYLGPVLLFIVAFPVLLRVVRLSKAQNITSLADFVGARYGKNRSVATVVTLIATISALPYIALQLKAVSTSLGAMLAFEGATAPSGWPLASDLAFIVALVLIVFAILFGTRHIDATRHQHGLMMAIAVESAVKLAALTIVGVFVVFVMFDGLDDIIARAASVPGVLDVLERPPRLENWLAYVGLSFSAALLLPRMFHVVVVENLSERDLRWAAWAFPAYLVAITLFILPIALAGAVLFAGRAVEPDTYVLALPLSNGSPTISLIVFIGGLSAATAMVIVATIAISVMITNEIVVPAILKHREARGGASGQADMGRVVLLARRLSIAGVILLAFVYYRTAALGEHLTSIGFIAFAAAAQIAPAFFAGLFWKRATATGAIAGMVAGLALWTYTLLLPSFVSTGFLPSGLLVEGPFGIAWLRPQSLLGIDLSPLAHGTATSLLANAIVFVAVSLARQPTVIEAAQAVIFQRGAVPPAAPSPNPWRISVRVADLEEAVARYLGAAETAASFREHAARLGVVLDPMAEADIQLLRHAEHVLAGVIGAASSRLVLSLILRRKNVPQGAALRLLDAASAAIQYSRDVLQTALDEVGQGIAVFDTENRLITWNRRFQSLLDLPADVARIGCGVDDLFLAIAERGDFGGEDIDEEVAQRLAAFAITGEPHRVRLQRSGVVIEMRTAPMPEGGTVATFADVTEEENAARDLARVNETLEQRVRDRTEELQRLNAELAAAKAVADEANLSKTRFLAAAGHDILQPLNAARLYVGSLVERDANDDDKRLARNVDQSLEAVEEIIGALLDISRLDAGAFRPEVTAFRLDELLHQLEVEFVPIARERGLAIDFAPTSVAVRSDRRLLRRLLQNLVSNAIKYTPKGRVLVGVRLRARDTVEIQVLDTGIGIPEDKQGAVFREFQRLEQGARAARGLGLGLSIVERIARVLDHPVRLASTVGRGSVFGVVVPRTTIASLPKSTKRVVNPVEKPLADVLALCIDNEEAILDGMSLLLGAWGAETLLVGRIEDAVTTAIAHARAIDVILADYHLDDSNGLDAIQAVRMAAGRDIPAILITADRSTVVRDRARDLGVAILNKPLKPAALRALISQWRVRRAAAAAE